VGTPSYLAPELLTLAQGQTYDGRAVDVWAAGVVLYVMLVGGYPFGDLANGRELVRRIASASYSIPVPVSPACADLLARIFVVDPLRRISVADIAEHAWCTAEPAPVLPWEGVDPPGGLQSVDELNAILRAAAEAGGEPPPEDDGAIPYTEADHLRDSMIDM
jgi:serine/threonine-protein kinase SRK2